MRILSNNKRLLSPAISELGLICDENTYDEISKFDFSSCKWEVIALDISRGCAEGVSTAKTLINFGFKGKIIGFLKSEIDSQLFDVSVAEFISNGGLYLLKSTCSDDLVTACVTSAFRISKSEKTIRPTTNLSWPQINSVFVMDIPSREFKINRKCVFLPKTLWSIMHFMLTRPEVVLSRDTILEQCFRSECVNQVSVDTAIKRLRAALGEESMYIKTVWGIGYKLSA